MSDPRPVGPHLLGRKFVEDLRDYTLKDLGDSMSWWSGFWSWLMSWFRPPPPPPPTPGAVSWADPIQLDQGQTPHCVGFGWAGWGDAQPVYDQFFNNDGHLIYYECKVIDGEPDAENGSAVRSGAKAMKARGRLNAYAFLTYAQAKAKIAESPLVFGTDWTAGMFNPTTLGFIYPTGQVEGGHCYLAIGYDPGTDVWQFQNSWGSSWGKGGRFFMHGNDVGYLQSQQGEICFALEVA